MQFYNVRVFVAGQALSNIGTFSQVVALSLLVLTLTESGVVLGAVMAVQGLPMIVLGSWAGAWLDRLPLRRVLFATAITGAAQATCLGLLALSGNMSVPWVLALAVGLGCVQTFERPASQAFLSELVPPQAIASGVSLASAAQAFGRLGGPALAAVLYAWNGAGSVFAVNAVSYVAVLVALLMLRTSEFQPRPAHSGPRTGMATALAFAWRSPPLRLVLLGNAFVGLLAFNFPVFFASIVSLTFGQPNLSGTCFSPACRISALRWCGTRPRRRRGCSSSRRAR
jgi:MFS family permease